MYEINTCRRKCHANGKSVPYSGTKAVQINNIREKDTEFLTSFFSPLLKDDDERIENLLYSSYDACDKFTKIGGVQLTRDLLACLRKGNDLPDLIMRVCCFLLKSRDETLCKFYNDVNRTNQYFQERVPTCFAVCTDSFDDLIMQLPLVPLHRIFITYRTSGIYTVIY